MPQEDKYHHASHSKYLLKYHFVFACKYRKKLLRHQNIADEIKLLFIDIAYKSGFAIDVMEVDDDHIHVLVDAPTTLSATSIATRLKGQSTFHIWKKFANFLSHHFWKEKTFWSDGYFVCTTGDASTETIKKYIEEQG
jgi:putative transposase